MKLYLEDGTSYAGEAFGHNGPATGEAVFATGMTGYVESLTDPSFAGQILVCTYPLIGNYGVPSPDVFESSRIHVAGLVVSEYSANYSHHDALQSLDSWLKAHKIPALTGVDTRAITKRLRERGVMLGQLNRGKPGAFEDPNRENLVARVSPKEIRVYGDGPLKIVLVDCGSKENIVRSLVRPGITLTRVPWNYDFTNDEYHALVLSNGPGDPEMCGPTVTHIRTAMRAGKPILGVCLGNQLLALAAGGSTYKLKYGHRSQNQPCIESATGRCYITSQNHGFAVDASTLSSGWSVWFTNANDGSVEGIRHSTKPWRSVQFHPESSPGPTDTAWIFDEFLNGLPKQIRI
ncbi:glutamine-hydrolyzing carbamoyl-phosphate synthase small subunit [Candidatus Kaiserbacteria bacterium]|nr:glutamine-hydrolyzing carbamoyl-phosphate synthase small subunit [Candidatus Kaiserbacteria bacterium]